MKLPCLGLLFLLVAVNAYYIDNDSEEKVKTKKDRIVGGRAAPIESLPYQAQLLQNGVQICGASIISNIWILTAAHCIVESSPEWSILTGSSSVSTGGQRHAVEDVIVHPDYDINTADNDMALIKLKSPIVFNERQKPIALSNRVPETGEKMTISGFGKLGNELGYAKTLQTANVPIIDHAFCQKQYNKDPITVNMFCAGRGPTDTCQGDSGGPGVINGELVGVVSAGMDCGSVKYPGIYAVVANYRQWLDSHMNKRKSLLGNSILFRPHKTVLGSIVDTFLGIGR